MRDWNERTTKDVRGCCWQALSLPVLALGAPEQEELRLSFIKADDMAPLAVAYAGHYFGTGTLRHPGGPGELENPAGSGDRRRAGRRPDAGRSAWRPTSALAPRPSW